MLVVILKMLSLQATAWKDPNLHNKEAEKNKETSKD